MRLPTCRPSDNFRLSSKHYQAELDQINVSEFLISNRRSGTPDRLSVCIKNFICRGDYNPGRAFGGSILMSSNNATVAKTVSTSPSEAYVLLIQSSSANTTGTYSLRTKGQGMDGIPGVS